MAKNWFTSSRPVNDILPPEAPGKRIREQLAPFNPDSDYQKHSGLKSYFVPDWRGESLISKDVKNFNKLLDRFQKDALRTFYKKEQLSRRIKINIYDEFLSYAEEMAINCTELDHYTTFWSEITNPDSKYATELRSFVEIICCRIAVMYLLKVRFIIIIQEKCKLSFDIKSIYYPNAYLTKIFKTASSTELKTKVFDQNAFSWFRPSEELIPDLLKFKEYCSALKITEIIKSISLKSEKILNEQTAYSHSLSHKKFGLFLNSLIINFPTWLSSLQQKGSKQPRNKLEVLSTKFAGDYLESMAMSHWLAQDSNKFVKWDKIICPDFKQTGFSSGLYLRSIHELQFLTFLAEIAPIQGKEPISFVSYVINSHLYNRKDSHNLQRSLLNNEGHETSSTYDRVILNLTDFPKNNPHHFLFAKIQEQKACLKERAHLYVITSKKLFVPSQKAKIENLIKDFKVEGIVSLDDVKGKGELGAYIYIFSLKNQFMPVSSKHSCLSFRLSGNLNTMQELGNITNLTQEFFNNNYNDLPPLYQKSSSGFKLEFFQDAIVNGQLIHSSSRDSSKITHPLFFRKLMNKCNSFDYYFEVQSIDFEENQEEDSLFNFSNSFKREKSAYTVIVDQRQKEDTVIEIIPSSTLEAKAYEYGHALCTYFYIYPKWPNLNFNLMRDFLDSTIGRQIINLTFNNEIRKVKGNLNKVLIPKFLLSKNTLPEHISKGLSILTISMDELFNYHPNDLEKTIEQIRDILPAIAKSYPKSVLELLSTFRRTIQQSSQKIGKNQKQSAINFSNPVLKAPLLLAKTYPIYPTHKDVHVEFNTDVLEKIHLPLTKVKMKSSTEVEARVYLELSHNDEPIISIYSDENMLYFLEFLLKNVTNLPIAKILQGIRVPELENLESILNSYKSLKRAILSLEQKISQDLNQLFNSVIIES